MPLKKNKPTNFKLSESQISYRERMQQIQQRMPLCYYLQDGIRFDHFQKAWLNENQNDVNWK